MLCFLCPPMHSLYATQFFFVYSIYLCVSHCNVCLSLTDWLAASVCNLILHSTCRPKIFQTQSIFHFIRGRHLPCGACLPVDMHRTEQDCCHLSYLLPCQAVHYDQTEQLNTLVSSCLQLCLYFTCLILVLHVRTLAPQIQLPDGFPRHKCAINFVCLLRKSNSVCLRTWQHSC